MNAEVNTQLRQMLASLLLGNPSRADQIPYGYDDGTSLEEGSGLKALQVLTAKADAGQSLNELEALGAQVLTLIAQAGNWAPRAPKEADPVIRTEHVAVVRGTYTVDGPVDRFIQGLSLIQFSGGYASEFTFEMLDSLPLSQGAGLTQVALKVKVNFVINKRVKDPTQLEDILKGMEVVFKHRSQPLPDIARYLENVISVEG